MKPIILKKTSRGFLGEKLEYIPSKFFCSQLGSYEKKQLFYQLEVMVQKQKISLKMPTFELDFIIAELETEIDELFTIIAEKLLKNEKKNKGHHKTADSSFKQVIERKIFTTNFICS